MKTYNIITIFPEMFVDAFSFGVISKAMNAGIIKINPINLRDYTFDRHKTTDDAPYGGGSGLVMKIEPIYKAVNELKHSSKVIMLDPRGTKFDQRVAERFSEFDSITVICGRYEGIDERVRDLCVDEEISIGDFVLTGGEFASLIFIDSIARLVPGVLGDEYSAVEESFSSGLLEYPHYTRPAEFCQKIIPDVLLSGHHEEIRKWRLKKSLKITLQNRPDLILNKTLNSEESSVLLELLKE